MGKEYIEYSIYVRDFDARATLTVMSKARLVDLLTTFVVFSSP